MSLIKAMTDQWIIHWHFVFLFYVFSLITVRFYWKSTVKVDSSQWDFTVCYMNEIIIINDHVLKLKNPNRWIIASYINLIMY